MNDKFPTPNYNSRKERNIFFLKLLEKNFSKIKTILNLGGGQKRYLKESPYTVTEIDMSGDNDITLNLDEIKKIPLDNKSFDAVVALDVLEHLENFHLILDEMNRLSKKYIFISLPNSFGSFFDIIFNKEKEDKMNNGFYNKFYGLPLKKPVDRHRWFLTVSDVERFFVHYANENKLSIKFLLPRVTSLKSRVLSLFLNKRLRKEILTKYVWIIIEKSEW